MNDYTKIKRVKIEDEGFCALEILKDVEGHVRFVLQHRSIDRAGRDCWVTIHTSGIYGDAESAETDGLLQWKDLRKAWFGGMTTNERLVLSGLISDWDDAVRVHDRERMVAILSAVDLGNQADSIIETVLQSAPGRIRLG